MKRMLLFLDRQTEPYAEEWLWAVGALSVSTPADHVVNRVVEALFDDDVHQDLLSTRVVEAASDWPGNLEKIRFEKVIEEAWQESWRANFKPLEAGDFRLVGEWEEVAEDPKLIKIYPGQAFGTGQHETTQLILETLSPMDLSGRKVLDVGCGTGILGIAAERLGAAEVFGFDADPDCEENMERHLRINHCERTRLAIGVLDDFTPRVYDLILANITLNVLGEVWPKLSGQLAESGILLSSGILGEQREQALALQKEAGFRVVEIREKGDWLMMRAVRT